MKNYFVVAILLLVPLVSHAQSETPKGEVYLGYSLGIADTGGLGNVTLHGLGFTAHAPFNDKVGLVGDVSLGWGSLFGISLDAQTFLAGVQFSGRGEKTTGFFRVMGGMARSGALGFSSTDPALGIGGGFDVSISDSLSYRVIQADYIPVFSIGTSSNFKIQTGIVFRFGKK